MENTMIPEEETHPMSNTSLDFFDSNFLKKSLFWFLSFICFLFGLLYFAFARHDSYAQKCLYHKWNTFSDLHADLAKTQSFWLLKF